MKKFISPTPNGGFPYRNSDFSNILQDQQYLISESLMQTYADAVTGTSVQDKGIIVSGLNILSGSTSSAIQISLTDALVFLNNEYMTSTLTGTTFIGTTGTCYIVEAGNVTEQRLFADGTAQNAIVEKKFNIVNTMPGSGNFIRIDFTDGCSRYLKDIMFNAQSSIGEVKILTNLSGFKSNGLGFGKWFGWAIADGRNGTFNFADKTVVGYNQQGGLAVPTSNPSPTQINTGAIGNTGGLNNNTLTEAQLPVVTKTANASLINIASKVNVVGVQGGSTANVYGLWSTGTNLQFNDPAQSQVQTTITFGSGQVVENRQPYIVAAYVQKIS